MENWFFVSVLYNREKAFRCSIFWQGWEGSGYIQLLPARLIIFRRFYSYLQFHELQREKEIYVGLVWFKPDVQACMTPLRNSTEKVFRVVASLWSLRWHIDGSCREYFMVKAIASVCHGVERTRICSKANPKYWKNSHSRFVYTETEKKRLLCEECSHVQ